MINEKTINEQYALVQKFLEEKRLKEALMQLEAFLWQNPEWDLRSKLEDIQTSYKYMLDYMRQGANDPERWNLYQKLVAGAWGIADEARLLMLDRSSPKLYHRVRLAHRQEEREITFLTEADDVMLAIDALEETNIIMKNDKTARATALPYLQTHNENLKIFFEDMWISGIWQPAIAKEAKRILDPDNHLNTGDICVLVSAITLGLMECFDIRKMMWLFDAYEHADAEVNQRALVGIVMACYIYRQRIHLYPELKERMDEMDEDPSFQKGIGRIYLQMLLCQETEKIKTTMEKDILPEMMKNIKELKKQRPPFEEEEHDSMNPEWTSMVDPSSKLADSLRWMSELQIQGADIYMSAFEKQKGYPFFADIHNWFYPFSLMHPAIHEQMKQFAEKFDKNHFVNVFLRIPVLCNSDKYSFLFTLRTFNPEQQQAMIMQFSSQEANELSEMLEEDTLNKNENRYTIISSQYLHDLYRFFKLFRLRHEFRDIFAEKLDFYNVPLLGDVLSISKYLYQVARFLLSKERWSEATEVFRKIEMQGESALFDAEFFQMYGYSLQKQKLYEEAIKKYLQADSIKPDNYWTSLHIAICHRMLHNYHIARKFYKEAEAVEPDNTNTLYSIAGCLTKERRYKDALNYFFKMELLEENSVRVWQGIGWCSFVEGKFEQAMKYYEKVIAAGKPEAADYMNAGHVAWAMGDLQKATAFYGKAIAAGESREQFLELFNKDKEDLLALGLPEQDIPLLLDLS